MSDMFFTKRDEYIFIDYINVIKCPDVLILKLIRDKLYNSYKGFLDIDYIKSMTDEDIDIFICSLNDKNIFDVLKIKDFNTSQAYDDIYNKYDDMFLKSELLKIGNLIKYIATNKFTKKIYLYTEEYDPRIDIDIDIEFNGISNIEYVHGEFSEVIAGINGITTYILDNQWNIPILEFQNKLKFTDVMLSNYGYNICKRNNEVMPVVMIENIIQKHVFKFALFNAFDISYRHENVLKKYIQNNN